jgi:hypothetical protein
MNRIPITAIKANIVFPEGKLPTIDAARPEFVLQLGPVEISGKVNAKAARKLAAHNGGAVLQGRLVVEGDRLALLDAGFTWIDPKPPAAAGQDAPRLIDAGTSPQEPTPDRAAAEE